MMLPTIVPRSLESFRRLIPYTEDHTACIRSILMVYLRSAPCVNVLEGFKADARIRPSKVMAVMHLCDRSSSPGLSSRGISMSLGEPSWALRSQVLLYSNLRTPVPYRRRFPESAEDSSSQFTVHHVSFTPSCQTVGHTPHTVVIV